MQLSFSRHIRRRCFFDGTKCAKIFFGAVMRYSRSKTSTVFESSKHSGGLVAALRFALVFCVLLPAYVAKIAKSIIAAVAVNVVNLTCRPISGNVKPRQTMTRIQLAIDRSHQVAFICSATRYCTFAYARLFVAARKHAGIRVIKQNFFDSYLVQHPRTLTHF